MSENHPMFSTLRDYAAGVVAAFSSVVEYLGGVWACLLRP
jgi:hypothetical protein